VVEVAAVAAAAKPLVLNPWDLPGVVVVQGYPQHPLEFVEGKFLHALEVVQGNFLHLLPRAGTQVLNWQALQVGVEVGAVGAVGEMGAASAAVAATAARVAVCC
jgi:hypothetical protein